MILIANVISSLGKICENLQKSKSTYILKIKKSKKAKKTSKLMAEFRAGNTLCNSRIPRQGTGREKYFDSWLG